MDVGGKFEICHVVNSEPMRYITAGKLILETSNSDIYTALYIFNHGIYAKFDPYSLLRTNRYLYKYTPE